MRWSVGGGLSVVVFGFCDMGPGERGDCRWENTEVCLGSGEVGRGFMVGVVFG
jgi:hypothetical protein